MSFAAEDVDVVIIGSGVGGGSVATQLAGSGAQGELFAGNSQDGLEATTVRGALTRPTFAPGIPEVWLGVAGRTRGQLIRVVLSQSGQPERAYPVSVPQLPAGDQIKAVRISPDGVRIALILTTPADSNGSLVIGSIVRGSAVLRVEALRTISPQDTVITDVAWLNSIRLFAIGHIASSQSYRTFDTAVAGSNWSSRAVNLFSAPDYVTATAGAVPWLSTGGFVWKQDFGSWVPPRGGQTAGSAPVYQE